MKCVFMLDPEESPTRFIEHISIYRTNPPAHRVPETTYWATVEQTVVGRISLRHTLNASLKEYGGHIGYEVRPSFRGKGIAKRMLNDILKTSKAKEIGRLLLTCSPENLASNRTILANSGILEKTVYVERVQRHTNYYWIDLNTEKNL